LLGGSALSRGRLSRAVVAVAWLAALAACASAPVREDLALAAGEAPRPVYVVLHGWHAGIVVRRADIPPDAWPEQEDFAGADYLEVGWGDRDGYMLPLTSASALKALFWPTESVLHVVGFRGPVREFFPRSPILELPLSARAVAALARHIGASYARDALGRSIRRAPSLYGAGAFYLSRERYHLFNTCNAWAARALVQAGLPLAPASALTTEALYEQLLPHGRLLPRARSAP
jgi:uncharacterized protein (TIGR02117 family)